MEIEEEGENDGTGFYNHDTIEEELSTQYPKYGFSMIIKLILESKKPIVGHNFIFDIGYIYHHFIEPLPDTYQQFIERLHELHFNNIYDTK